MATKADLAHRFQLDAKAVEYYREHPVEFVETNFDLGGHTLSQQQKEFLNVVSQIKAGTLQDRQGRPYIGIVVFAGHGVGKTASLAWLIQWWEYCFDGCKIPVTSTKKEQLADNLWPELKHWQTRSLLREDYEWEKTKFFLRGQGEESFAVARTASTQEALQGFHHKNLLFIVEEASGVEDGIFQPILGALTNDNAVMIMVGNPTRSSGFFYDAFTKHNSRFYKLHIPCIDKRGVIHPNVGADYPSLIANTYGIDSNIYRVRVLGLPPRADDDTIIPLEWVTDSFTRQVSQSDLYRVVWGLDVARFGSDRTVLCKRRGNIVPEPVKWWAGKSTMEVAGIIKHEYEETEEDDRPSEIMVDVIGIGAGVVDRLTELGLPVRGINVAESPSFRSKYSRLRDELWFKAREWFESRKCKIPNDSNDFDDGGGSLVAELTTMKYGIESNGKLKAESKDDYRKRLPLIGSPDRADAFCLTFAGGLERIDDHKIDRYKRIRRKERVKSWIGA